MESTLHAKFHHHQCSISALGQKKLKIAPLKEINTAACALHSAGGKKDYFVPVSQKCAKIYMMQ